MEEKQKQSGHSKEWYSLFNWTWNSNVEFIENGN